MKSFFKYVLATIVGIIVVNIVSFLFFLIIIGGLVSTIGSQTDKPVEVKPNSTLTIKLNKQIVDRAPEIPFEIEALNMSAPLGLNHILKSIKKAKTDDNIEGIYIELSFFGAGQATLEEIRNALDDFKTSGKFVVCYSEMYSQPGYYLASVADKVFINPAGFFTIMGVNSNRMFLKNTMKKLGVDVTVIQTGDYKTCGEQFTKDEISEASEEQIMQYIGVFWNEWKQKISESRGIQQEEIDKMANELLIKNPADAIKFGLMDSLVYKDQVIAYLKAKNGIDEGKKLPQISIKKYKNAAVKKNKKGTDKEKIAVIYASGGIVSGKGDDENIGSDKYSKIIRKIRRDSTFKAIVLRVNSPGGSALASDVIWREVKLASEVKPVIVSMGDVAASGGYYISCAADKIYANNMTVTGSIGVVFTHFNTENMFGKIGVDFDNVKTNPHADLLSTVRKVDGPERMYIENFINYTYDTFLYHVADGRGLTYDQVHASAQGRVWAGNAAIENKLVDKKAGLMDAIDESVSMAGLGEDYKIVEFPKIEEPFEKFIKELTGEAKLKNTLQLLGISYRDYKMMMDLYREDGCKMIMPFSTEVR
ncbi:MAG: signal peptide peptidase SppA [Bacteroidales bacterium]|nr:signal peptide peptidase SppA [Bacteroidales bacterium]